MLYCQASHLILITHFLPIQIICPAVDDTFYVNNIKMKIAQTSYNSLMLLPTLGAISPNHSLCSAYQICSQQQTQCTLQWNFFFFFFFSSKGRFVLFLAIFNIIVLIIHRPVGTWNRKKLFQIRSSLVHFMHKADGSTQELSFSTAAHDKFPVLF